MYLEKRKCSSQLKISQAALLAVIKTKLQSAQQLLWIQPKEAGLPDGGSFKLQLGSDITNNIDYNQNYNYVEATIRRGLEPFAEVSVQARSSTQFTINFIGSSEGLNYPLLIVKENNLTLAGLPAGLIQTNIRRQGGVPRSLYTMLRELPLSKWSITSFNPQSQEVCVKINNVNITVNIPSA
jgi:hypothetical protein